MDTVFNHQRIPAHLPKRLTLSFPIWGLFDSDGKGVYADMDRFVREHKERGFNCIRLEDGAGLIHDKDGNRLPPIEWGWGFGDRDEFIRQNICVKGKVDVYTRLIDLFKAAKKYDVYVVLTSFYYLHTYWYLKDKALNDSLLAIDPHERYERFAKYLHYILCELEREGLDDRIAFAEIFNEADGLAFCGGYGNRRGVSDEERARFCEEHEKALAFLRAEHPQILFAYDASRPSLDENLAPKNAQVYNFHSYFMWSAYSAIQNDPSWLASERVSVEKLLSMINYPDLFPDDWKRMITFYGNLDASKIDEMNKALTEQFLRERESHEEKLHKNLASAKHHMDGIYRDCLCVCGEGVSYSGSYALVWEEYCPEYWELLRHTMLENRRLGLWGSVIRTCCGPEDPVWNSHPDKLRELNALFLHGEQ